MKTKRNKNKKKIKNMALKNPNYSETLFFFCFTWCDCVTV